MDRLEGVFLDEDPIITENNGNFWQSLDGEIKKLKIGEIFQLENNTLSLSCIRCCETFQYFTEFSLHIQEHYLHGDIANLKEIKEEPAEHIHDDNNVSSVVVDCAANQSNLQNTSLQSIKNEDNSNDSINLSPSDCIDDNSGVFQNDFEAEDMDVHSEAASDDESKENIQKSATKNDKNSQSSFVEPKTLEFVEGEHYIQDGRLKRCLTCDRVIERWDHLKDHLYTHVAEKNVICPICSKAFTSIAYVRKHCGKVHKKKLSSIEIKAAQQLCGGAASVVNIRIKSNLNETNAMAQCTEKPNESPNKRPSLMNRYKCVQCNKQFSQPRYLQKHLRCVHSIRVQIQSIVATQRMSSNDESTVIMHEPAINVKKKACNESAKNYECFECHKVFTRPQSLRKHLKLHSGKKYKCIVNDCHRIFAQPHYVMDHLAILHGLQKTSTLRAKIQPISAADYYFESESQKNVSSYQCYLCKNEYSSKLRLNVHFKNHLNGFLLCSHCGGTYKSADTLRHHMERHQANPDAPVQCPRCDKTYPTRRYMLRHFRIMHAADREDNKRKSAKPKKTATEMFDCEIDECDRKFSSVSRMKQHLATHNRKNNTCQLCGWTCKLKSNLNQHMRVHSAEIKSSCTICNKVLSSRYLAEHMKIHAGIKSIQCEQCGLSCFNTQRLKRHIAVVHVREMRFHCELCTRKFSSSDKLLVHRRSHNEQMDHVCHICKLGFYSIRSLRKHCNAHYLEGHSIASLKLETEN